MDFSYILKCMCHLVSQRVLGAPAQAQAGLFLNSLYYSRAPTSDTLLIFRAVYRIQDKPKNNAHKALLLSMTKYGDNQIILYPN